MVLRCFLWVPCCLEQSSKVIPDTGAALKLICEILTPPCWCSLLGHPTPLQTHKRSSVPVQQPHCRSAKSGTAFSYSLAA